MEIQVEKTNLSVYEVLRQDNIKRNKAKLVELGISEVETTIAVAENKQPTRSKRKVDQILPSRASSRVGIPVVSKDNQELLGHEDLGCPLCGIWTTGLIFANDAIRDLRYHQANSQMCLSLREEGKEGRQIIEGSGASRKKKQEKDTICNDHGN